MARFLFSYYHHNQYYFWAKLIFIILIFDRMVVFSGTELVMLNCVLRPAFRAHNSCFDIRDFLSPAIAWHWTP